MLPLRCTLQIFIVFKLIFIASIFITSVMHFNTADTNFMNSELLSDA